MRLRKAGKMKNSTLGGSAQMKYLFSSFSLAALLGVRGLRKIDHICVLPWALPIQRRSCDAWALSALRHGCADHFQAFLTFDQNVTLVAKMQHARDI
jgi:hypothetical protein